MAKNYGFFKTDDNYKVIHTATGFTTQDATGTPQTSPLAFSSSEITIEIPTNAAEIVLFPTQDLRVSEVTGMARYDVVAKDTKEVFAVANLDQIYIKRDSTDGNLRFRFLTV